MSTNLVVFRGQEVPLVKSEGRVSVARPRVAPGIWHKWPDRTTAPGVGRVHASGCVWMESWSPLVPPTGSPEELSEVGYDGTTWDQPRNLARGQLTTLERMPSVELGTGRAGDAAAARVRPRGGRADLHRPPHRPGDDGRPVPRPAALHRRARRRARRPAGLRDLPQRHDRDRPARRPLLLEDAHHDDGRHRGRGGRGSTASRPMQRATSPSSPRSRRGTASPSSTSSTWPTGLDLEEHYEDADSMYWRYADAVGYYAVPAERQRQHAGVRHVASSTRTAEPRRPLQLRLLPHEPAADRPRRTCTACRPSSCTRTGSTATSAPSSRRWSTSTPTGTRSSRGRSTSPCATSSRWGYLARRTTARSLGGAQVVPQRGSTTPTRRRAARRRGVRPRGVRRVDARARSTTTRPGCSSPDGWWRCSASTASSAGSTARHGP